MNSESLWNYRELPGRSQIRRSGTTEQSSTTNWCGGVPWLSIRPLRNRGSSNAEHIRILEELRAGNLPEARTLLHQHIGESLDVVLDRVTRAITALSLANITD